MRQPRSERTSALRNRRSNESRRSARLPHLLWPPARRLIRGAVANTGAKPFCETGRVTAWSQLTLEQSGQRRAYGVEGPSRGTTRPAACRPQSEAQPGDQDRLDDPAYSQAHDGRTRQASQPQPGDGAADDRHGPPLRNIALVHNATYCTLREYLSPMPHHARQTVASHCGTLNVHVRR
jgi:hypothetical protein